MVARCVETLGGVDVLVAAAGIASPRRQRTGAISRTRVLGIPDRGSSGAVIDVNLYGVPLLEPRGRPLDGRQPSRRQHRQSRLDHVEDALAGRRVQREQGRRVDADQEPGPELAAQGIRVNAIGPGFIETPMTAAAAWRRRPLASWAMNMTPMGRFGTPEEVASTALFLASDDAAFFTGEILHPSGGVSVG